MRVTCDPEGENVYIYLKEIGDSEAASQVVVDDERTAATIILDLDAEGVLIGIEVLGANGVPPELVKDAPES